MDESTLKRGSSNSGLVKLGCEVKVPGTGFQYHLHSYQLHHSHYTQQNIDNFKLVLHNQSTTKTMKIVGLVSIGFVTIFAVSLFLTSILLERRK